MQEIFGHFGEFQANVTATQSTYFLIFINYSNFTKKQSQKSKYDLQRFKNRKY
jgi:hypothetical protein